MDIGINIKEARRAKKMTQVELAALADISRSYLADVEAGRYNPSLETLSKLAQALDIEVSALFSGNTGHPAETSKAQGISTIAAHKVDGYEDGLTEDEKIAVRAFLEAYRKQKQMEKEKKGD
ncbi:MAG: helix-turn-helix transcriptional regulator [Clostridiaceae bacterium]|jgi:transcriptional regulator with XRE-family HTH domain|nr:helix-turn-helix transcriptional regulator [Clostridiaceae bacterium]